MLPHNMATSSQAELTAIPIKHLFDNMESKFITSAQYLSQLDGMRLSAALQLLTHRPQA